MSKFLLPKQRKQYTTFNDNSNIQQTKTQIDALNSNKSDVQIRKHYNPAIYNNSEEQIINGNNQYIQDKLNYLNEHKKQYVSDVNISDLYDPLIEYDRQRNLIQDKLIQFQDYYIEINSRNRETELKINIDSEYKLSSNPFTLTKGTNTIYINHKNHNFKKDDKIMIQGFTAQTFTRIYEPLNNNNYSIIFNDNLKYIMIRYSHGLSNTTNKDYYCSIEDLTNPPNNIYIGNIPLTFLNGTHKILLSVSEDIIFKDIDNNEYPAIYSPDRFYIELPYKYVSGTVTENTINSSMSRNYKLKLFYIYNIPILELNAGYPQTEYQQNNYYIINSADNNGYTIKINTSADWLDDTITKNIGGDNIRIIKIKNIENNYPNTNNYTIKLPRSFKNIVRVEIVGSEFPNIENNVYKINNDQYDSNDFNSQKYYQNNKFYWQNYIDGSNYTYSIEIPPGKYTPETLKETMEKLIYNTPRVYYLKQQFNDKKYTNHNVMNISFDINKNLSIFKMFTEYIFNHSIKGLFYIHNDSSDNSQKFIKITNKSDLPENDNNEQQNPLFLLIKCDSHDKNTNNQYNKLESDISTKGDIIEIVNLDNYMNIPGNIINGNYEIYKIPKTMYTYLDNEYIEINDLSPENYFMIQLPNVDIFDKYITDNPIDNEGGVFICKLPLDFRLLFNSKDTIGEMIGFSNVGDQNSITNWSNTITNQDNYISNVGNIITNSSNNYLDFNGEKYINIVCKEIPIFENITGIDNIFARIMMKKGFNQMNYNTFINNAKYFLTPINEINSLSFKFYNTKNILCDFGNIDHSFVIKITTINKSQLRTNISSYTGTQL